ncbi:MAG: hypothetical protein WBM50_12095 [Acidimicrobiales bacterium]
MAKRFDVQAEIRRILSAETEHALTVLPSFAGEILAAGEPADVQDLKDALGLHVLHQRNNVDVAEAVLAMVRTYSIRSRAHYAK